MHAQDGRTTGVTTQQVFKRPRGKHLKCPFIGKNSLKEFNCDLPVIVSFECVLSRGAPGTAS